LNKVLIDKSNVLFLVEDHKLIDDESMFLINSLMDSADPWLIYTKEELEPIKQNLVEQLKDSSLSVEKYIQKMCYEKLKIIMVID